MSVEHPPLAEEAFQLMPGCPTLTIEFKKVERCLPYHSFKWATYHSQSITLKFESSFLVICGRNLDELWRHLQVQDVRTIKCHEGAEDELAVTSIDWGDDEED